MLGHCLLCNAIRPLACCHIPAPDQSWHVMVMLNMQALSVVHGLGLCAVPYMLPISRGLGPLYLLSTLQLPVLRPLRRLGGTKSRHQPLICASIEGPDRPC